MEKSIYRCWLKRLAEMPKASETPAETAAAELTEGFAELGVNESFEINVSGSGEDFCITKEDNKYIVSGGEIGVLYGAYHVLFKLALGKNAETSGVEKPSFKLRMINHWDNVDGSVERGYSGNSIFFANNDLCYDPDRIRTYARLLASVGINTVSINNVNVHFHAIKLITEEFLPKVAQLADIFRAYGIRLLLSVNFASPIHISGYETADPKDEKVVDWWNKRFELIYKHIPDLAGVVLKADSENQPGPFKYGLNHAEGSSAIAKAIKPFGGIVIWRSFVYNCKQDWWDTKTDRPKAAYDNYYPLDGSFEDNVILQVKNGPYDFQVREPVSPLLGAMKKTDQALELQLAQEYTGQQIDIYYMPPMWKEVLSFDTKLGERSVISQMAGNKISSIAAVSNIGSDENLTGNALAAANLFAYGRTAWNPNADIDEYTKEWIRLTLGDNEEVGKIVFDMLLKSRQVYESYTAPLALCWMVRVHYHYGPDPEGYEFSKWGTYHRANREAIGIDRTINGTGYTRQYSPENCAMFESIETCPQELLLFFHRLSYDFRLKDERTLIQYIYDTRFEGAAAVEHFIEQWSSLEGLVESSIYNNVKERLNLQYENACDWRDVLNTYFYRMSGIKDEKDRIVHQ